jgi:hypothetical protein
VSQVLQERWSLSASQPSRGGDLGQDRLDDMRILGDAELIRTAKRIGFRDGFVRKLLDEDVRFDGDRTDHFGELA